MKKNYFMGALSLGLLGLATVSEAQIMTQTVSYTGALQTWTVPSCVTSVTIDCYGATGGAGATGGNSSTGGAGGLGSKVSATTTGLIAGDVLNIFVGGAGLTPAGGFNGGGNGGNQNAGGGGGATDVRLNSILITSRVITAAGGGGGGRGGCEPLIAGGGTGGNGGSNGVNGTDAPTSGGVAGGGNGAVGATGGSAGIGCGGFLGSPGNTATTEIGADGGAGQTCCCFSAGSIPGGGGGGGGFIGGGGGGGGSAGTTGCSGNDKGAGGGGAGGSNNVQGIFTNNGIVTGANVGNGYVVISYNLIPPVAIAVSSSTVCNGSSVTLTASGATTYSWSNGASSTTIAASPSTDVTYTVTGTIGTCVTTNTTMISVFSTPTVSVSSTPTSMCVGATSTVSASGATSYVWNTTGNTASIVVTPTTTTVYSVVGSYTTGCSDTKTISVTVNSLPTLTVNSGSICAGQSFTISPSGASTFTYSSGSAVVTPTSSINNYTISGTDANGCIGNVVNTVTVNANPSVTVNSGSICAGQSFTLVPTGATTYSYSGGSSVVSPSSNASYTVTGTDAIGCSALAVSSITVNSNPTVVATSNSTLLCVGNSATLTASGAATYTWSTGSNTTSIIVSPTVTATYTLNGTNTVGCTNSTVLTQSVSSCVGINELLSADLSVIIFPNPNKGLFNLELNAISKVIIISNLGQIVFNETLNAGTQNIDIQNKANGTYFIKVIQNDKQQVIKLVKE